MKTKSFESYVTRCGNNLLKICARVGAKTTVLSRWNDEARLRRTITVTCEESLMERIEQEWMDSMKIKYSETI